MKEKPATKLVYFHGLVTDNDGAKMSKSKGNVLNPDDLVKTYGIDRMRLAILESLNQSKTIRFDPENFRVIKLINKLHSLSKLTTTLESDEGVRIYYIEVEL